MRRGYCALVVLSVLLIVLGAGCQGDHTAVATGGGQAMLTIRWPERGRMIPAAASSIVIGLRYNGRQVDEQVVDRPQDGNTSQITFSHLASGTYLAWATAYPQSGGRGTPVAEGQVSFVVTPGGETPFTLTLASTISEMALTPARPAIQVGQQTQLSAVAWDDAGEVVLTTPGKLQWSAQNRPGSAATGAVVTVSDTGAVTAAVPGSAEVTVVDTESGARATATVTVTAAPPVSVTVTPAMVTLDPGEGVQFSARVTGSTETSVVWSIMESGSGIQSITGRASNGGMVSSGGYYVAPAMPGTYHVVATSTADETSSDVATVVVPAPQVSISLTPTDVSLQPGGVQQFAAAVTGSSDTGVTWRVQEGDTGGSVTGNGVYIAPHTAGIYHVIATSKADPAKSAVATVRVLLGVTLQPAAVTVPPGGTVTFLAALTGSDSTAVAWQVQEGAAGGSVTVDTASPLRAVYTAPAVAGTYHVTVTSQVDPTRSATAVVTVTP